MFEIQKYKGKKTYIIFFFLHMLKGNMFFFFMPLPHIMNLIQDY